MKTTKHLIRRIVAQAVAPLGFRVSGNLIFSRLEWSKIERGVYCHAVSERPDLYPARVVRFASILGDTYV